MEQLTMTGHDILAYLGITGDDADACRALLAAPPSPAVLELEDLLAARLGTATGMAPGGPGTEPERIAALLRFAPRLIDWHRGRGIPEQVSRATLADVGRNLAIHRRVHGRFGLETWRWLTLHYAGALYALGRLQFALHRAPDGLPGTAAGTWILGIHIPESGPLDPAAVAGSLAQAGPFFARHFPEFPVRLADCESWLLDPYLAQRLDPESNLARFAALFTPYRAPADQPSDAVYFTFRTRSMEGLAALPRETTLQRLVLDRIGAGGTWQLGYGYLVLGG
ncbi:MAG: acyltransferase domain-containing protein [Actinomycetales bacterium]